MYTLLKGINHQTLMDHNNIVFGLKWLDNGDHLNDSIMCDYCDNSWFEAFSLKKVNLCDKVKKKGVTYGHVGI